MTHVAVTPTSGHRLILGMGHSLHPAMWTVVRHYDSRGGNAHFRSQAHLGVPEDAVDEIVGGRDGRVSEDSSYKNIESDNFDKTECKTETQQSKADEIQCKERGVLSPEQVEVEAELDRSVLEEQLYSPSLSRLWWSGACILHYEAKEDDQELNDSTFDMQEEEYALSKDIDVALWIDYR
ncbi:hypothetical protein EMCRGX_G010497 [Ephydatia muelleri]